MNNRIQLSEHFTYGKLARFVMPSVIMMIFTSIYCIIDGLFVSNFVGKTPFAAINIIYPLIMCIAAIGFMIGTGGSALVSVTLGEKNNKKANEYFSMLIYATVIIGVVLAIVAIIFTRPIAYMLGADEALIEYCVMYGRIILAAQPAFMLQYVFQSFFVTAEKPKLGLGVTVAAGITNIVLDALFIIVFKWGLAGAAIATATSQIVGGVVPIIYFFNKNNSLLKLIRAKFIPRAFIKVCSNGASELMTNISASFVTILYNYQLMKLAGQDGVAAYGVIMYANFIFSAIYFGYSIGSAPLFGYHHGALNTLELKNLFKKSIILILSCGIVLTLTAEITAPVLSSVFVGYDVQLHEMTQYGFRLYALSFLICGINIFSSAFFTALNNGLVSAVISFMRILFFQSAAVTLLPMIFKLNGIWLAITAAELGAVVISCFFFIKMRKKYNYI